MIPQKYQINGLFLVVVIGLLVQFLSQFIPGVNAVMAGLLVGIVLGNIVKMPQHFAAGVSFVSSKFLELSILFLAFSIQTSHMVELGWQNLLLVVLTMLFVLFASLFLSKKFNCPSATGLLVGFGTAICGSSAIAAAAPSISKGKEDPGIALAVVNLIGTIGMLAMPFMLKWAGANATDSGVLIGATLHSVGNVAGAGYAMDSGIGDTAITIKMARVALLSPAVILFNFIVNKAEKKSFKSYFNLPFYLWGFIIITIVGSMFSLPAPFVSSMSTIGKSVLTIAMVAIGLKVSFSQLFHAGRKAFGFGIVLFVLQIAVVLLLIWVQRFL